MSDAGDAVVRESAAVPETALLECLTDEELAVLSVHEGVAVTPHLSAVSPRDRAPLLQTAYRSLVARGIVEPPTAVARARARARLAQDRAEAAAGGGSGSDPRIGVDVQVRQDVGVLLTLRRGAQAVVAMARTAAVVQDYVYVYLVDDVLLVEIVSADGFHRFSLRRTADLLSTVLDTAVLPDAGDGHGDAVPVTIEPGDPTPPDRLLDEAGAALLRCDLTVLVPDNPEPLLLGLFSAPSGSWVFESRFGSGDPVLARPVTAAELRVAVVAALGDLGTSA
ncbi:hypothetical protein [Cellulomonas sp. KRMCY2]|uniref:hypothetical protein n=1 Tax=Cellulomonas sp. KRMCY2 TaxID=1304865 RepID=UPI0012DFCE96|nr:hypothetical protein [Cellulomonas sp. KRMCY2]